MGLRPGRGLPLRLLGRGPMSQLALVGELVKAYRDGYCIHEYSFWNTCGIIIVVKQSERSIMGSKTKDIE